MRTLALTLLCLFVCSVSSTYAEEGPALSLKESVTLAVEQNPQIKAMLHNRDAMSSNTAAALGRFFPTLDLRSAAGLQQYRSQGTRATGRDDDFRTVTDTTVSMRLNVFEGMRGVDTYQGAKRRLSSAEYRLYDNVESIGLDAIRSHHDIVRERRLLALAQKNIEQHKELLGSIAERVEAGATSRADETQANSRLARAETTLITYQGKLRNAEADYKWATGVMPGELLQPAFQASLLSGDLKSVLASCQENNPKIKAAEEDILALTRDKGVAQSRYYPKVDMVLSSRHTDDMDGSDSYLQDNRGMVEVSWNLFNGTSDYHTAKAADARVKESEATLERTRLDVQRSVVSAWSDYQTASKEVENYEKALAFSVETNDMYLMQFNVGQRSLLDMLDSLNEVFNNSVLLETALMNRSFSLYKLLALQGRLIQSLDVSKQSYAAK